MKAKDSVKPAHNSAHPGAAANAAPQPAAAPAPSGSPATPTAPAGSPGTIIKPNHALNAEDLKVIQSAAKILNQFIPPSLAKPTPSPATPNTPPPPAMPPPVITPPPLIEYPFESSVRVEIVGGFRKEHIRFVRIDDGPPIPLQRREFYPLFLIACLALGQAGQPAPMEVRSDTPFLSTKSLLRSIKLIEERHMFLNKAYSDWGPEIIHKLVFSLRKKLGKKISDSDATPVIIETLRGVGVRLSVPPENVKLTYIAP